MNIQTNNILKFFCLFIVCWVTVSLLPLSFWPFTSCLYLIQQWLYIACIWYSKPQHRIFDLFDLLSIVSLHHPSTHCLLAFCFNITCIWYSEPQHRMFDLFDLLSIISLHRPSTPCLLAFCFNITCIWYSEPQHRISDLFGLLSIISLHCPSTHCLLAFCLLLVFDSASLNQFLIYLIYSLLSLSSSFYTSSFHPFALLVFDTAISLSWAPTQLASLQNTLCLLSIHALVATVFHSSFEQDCPRIVQFHPISSSLATSKLILPR